MVAALDQEIDTHANTWNTPNIVQYLGCERKEFSISIYLEYIPGGSIGQLSSQARQVRRIRGTLTHTTRRSKDWRISTKKASSTVT